MGLDMYLLKRNGIDENGNKVEDEKIGYWRKFNALHDLVACNYAPSWDTNCEEVDLPLNSLCYILDVLHKAKDILLKGTKCYNTVGEDEIDTGEGEDDDYYWYDDETVEEIEGVLPPRPGFFFGSTDIDCYYEYKLDSAIEIFTKAVELAKAGEDIYYYCWW